MLCEACQEIFSRPRELSCGTYYAWNQTAASFVTALAAGCHLCCLIEENRSDSRYSDANSWQQSFPHEIEYAFKALNPIWARSGNGSKWMVPQISGFDGGDEAIEIITYLAAVRRDPTPNNLGHLLATDSDEVLSDSSDFWLVLELYGPGAHLVLPIELVERDRLPLLEQMAQSQLTEQLTSGSTENLQIANTWLNSCKHNHRSCKPQNTEHWLPTRLLYVGTQDSPDLRLILGSSINVESEYAALSHRWGTNKSFVLTLARIEQYMEGIPAKNISSTLQDAVRITRGLGLQYLWVDSMCIVQDEDDDWARESATMSRVYGLSTCTIAAANSGSGDAGCFATRNPHRVRPCIIPNPFRTESKYSFYVRSQYLHDIHRKEVKDSLWYNRGWVFQERTLSRRLLIFGKSQMLWACEELQAAETWPCGKTSKDFIDQFESFEVERARFHALLDQSKGVATDNKTWWTFIQDYTGAKLTRMTDKLAALQGLATQVESLTGQQYCAGFWMNNNLPTSLLWAAAKPPFPYPQEYRAPSWSWASIDGAVNFNHGRFEGTTMIHVLGNHEISDIPHNKRSNNRNAPRIALQLSGKLLKVTLTTSHNGIPERLITHSMRAPNTESKPEPEPEPLSTAPNARNLSSRPDLSKFGKSINSSHDTAATKSVRGSKNRGLLKCIDTFEKKIRKELHLTDKERELRRRRQRVEEGLALIGTAGWQALMTPDDPGNPEPESLALGGGDPELEVKCFYDSPLQESQQMEIFVLPILQSGRIQDRWAEVQGLLLQSVDGYPQKNHYRRIGMFEMYRFELKKFVHVPEEEAFFLV